jgi:hypothetical protein
MVPINPNLLNLFTILSSLYPLPQEPPEPASASTTPPPGPHVVDGSRADQRVDQLLLVVQAMWTLVQEKTGLTDAELVARVSELDGGDGVVDGRIVRPPVKCAKCGAAVSRKFNRCLFCGKPYLEGNVLDTV